MRGLFFLLLLSNAAFFVWQIVTPLEEGVNDSVLSAPVIKDGLTLLSELAPEKRPSLREAAGDDLVPVMPHSGESGQETNASVSSSETTYEESSDEAGKALCWRVDAIDSEAALEGLLRLLQGNGGRVIEKSETQGTKSNYWVMLPPYPNRAKADEAAAILGGKRIKDFFIVRSGEYENAVSLGVFSERERAERRYDQIVALKVRLRKPRVETIDLPAKYYSVIFSTQDVTAQRRVLDRLNTIGNAAVKKVTCK